MSLTVDVIVPVHTPFRPIERAVESVLAHNRSQVRVLVVIHNTDPEPILARLKLWEADERLTISHFQDGISSPAGPMNHGLEQSQADFVSFMGSDDSLSPGAVDAWLSLQRRAGADIVIAPVRNERGTMTPTPPVRPFRWSGLKIQADRLAYRSAPLGLVSRRRFQNLRFTGGLKSGEDVFYTMQLWLSGAEIVFKRSSPAYIVHDDADDRVTFAPRPVREDFAFLKSIIAAPEFFDMSVDNRTAIGVKMFRAHLFDAVRNREGLAWAEGQRAELAEVAKSLIAWSPRSVLLLSLRERRLLDAVLDERLANEKLDVVSRKRRQYFSLGAVCTRNPLLFLHRQGPFRFGLATVLLSYR